MLKSVFLMSNSQEIGSSLTLLKMIFEALQSELQVQIQVSFSRFKNPKIPGIQPKYMLTNLLNEDALRRDSFGVCNTFSSNSSVSGISSVFSLNDFKKYRVSDMARTVLVIDVGELMASSRFR